jgi:hypothetical protein
MDPEVLRSYMVKLGVQIDTAAFDKMKKMLGDLESVMGKHASSTAMQATKGVGMIVGAYATLMISIGKLIKTTADADMQFQLLGQKMYMSTEAVKAFKQATDTLGHSVQEIAWNAELRSKYFVLVKDIQNLSVPADAKDMMRQVRGIGFEFDRLKLASKLTLEQVAYNLMRINKGELTDIRTTFGNWVNNVYSKIPEMARKIAEFLQPFIQLGQSVIKFFKDLWESMKPTRDMISDIVGKLGEFYDKIPPIYKQILLLAGALGLIFAMGSPIMLAMGVFIGALALIDDYMQFKDGKESMNALVPIWIALDYVITKAATAMGFFAIAYSHFIAFMKGEKHESGKTFFQDISDYATFSDTRWKNKMWEIGEKRKATIEENKRIEAQEAAGMVPTGGVPTGGGMIGPVGAQELRTGGGQGKVSTPISLSRNVLTEAQKSEVEKAQSKGLNAMAFVETRGKANEYAMRGVPTKYGRAIGRYQIMPAFWNDFARRAGLPSGTPPTPDNQDYVASVNWNYYVDKYKNEELAAVAWFSGEGAADKVRAGHSGPLGLRDATGTSVSGYAALYRRARAKELAGGVVASTAGGAGGGGGEPKEAPEDFNKYMSQFKNAPSKVDRSTGRPPIWPMYLKEGEYRLPNAVEMARFGKYTTEAFIGSPLLAAAVGADKAMKKIQTSSDKATKVALDTLMGKKLHQQYTITAGRVSAAAGAVKDYGKGYGKKVVNQVSFVIHAGAASAEDIANFAKKKFNEYANKDKNKSGVRKSLASK